MNLTITNVEYKINPTYEGFRQAKWHPTVISSLDCYGGKPCKLSKFKEKK